MGRLRRAGVVLLVVWLAACGGTDPAGEPTTGPSDVPPTVLAEGSAATSTPDDATLFGYDGNAPEIQASRPEDRHDAVVSDASFPSPDGGSVTAWLVEPLTAGPHAGLVYLHGSETGRNDLVDEAVAAASGGAVSLVPDAPFRRPGSPGRIGDFDNPEDEAAMTAQAVVEVRVALDALAARDDVDPARLALVGHSWGAAEAAVVAAVDPRVAAVVLITPRPSWTDFLQTSPQPFAERWRATQEEESRQRYVGLMAPFDALPRIDRIEGMVLVQFGSLDEVVPPDIATQLVEAAPEGTQVQHFDAGHALDAEAVAARMDFLGARVGLGEIPQPVLATVGLPDE